MADNNLENLEDASVRMFKLMRKKGAVNSRGVSRTHWTYQEHGI